MGDAKRRRMLLKPFPPVVVPKELPGHRKGCFMPVSIETASCSCARQDRIDARHRSQTIALLAAAAVLSSNVEPDRG